MAGSNGILGRSWRLFGWPWMVWAALGKGFGSSWASLGPSGAALGASLEGLGQPWSPRAVKEGGDPEFLAIFGMPFEGVWAALGDQSQARSR